MARSNLQFMAAILLYVAHAPVAAQPNWTPPIEMVDPAPDGRRIGEDGLVGNWYPAPTKTAPAILLLGGSEGGLAMGNSQAARALQSAGFAVLQLAYFRAPGQSPSLELVQLELFDQAIAWMARQPGVDRRRIGVVGTSKGAEAALLVASRNSAVRAVVAGVPSSVAWPGVVWEGTWGTMPKPSWSANGKPVPVVPYGEFQGSIRSLYDNGLLTRDQHQDAIIPVERSKAAILLVCGEQDSLWPSCPMANQVAARAEQAGPKVKVLAFDDAGHFAFGPPISATSPFYPRLGGMGGTVEGNATARMQGWSATIQFLRRKLK